MESTKVVDLGMVRDVLAEWERVRAGIATGRISFSVALMNHDTGQETLYLGGAYKQDPVLAMRSILKHSTARALEDDYLPKPPFRKGG